jgi:hypothetical protein
MWISRPYKMKMKIFTHPIELFKEAVRVFGFYGEFST